MRRLTLALLILLLAARSWAGSALTIADAHACCDPMSPAHVVNLLAEPSEPVSQAVSLHAEYGAPASISALAADIDRADDCSEAADCPLCHGAVPLSAAAPRSILQRARQQPVTAVPAFVSAEARPDLRPPIPHA